MIALLLLVGGMTTVQVGSDTTAKVVLVTVDGVRWQEVFGGADTLLMTEEAGGVDDPSRLRDEFWRASPEERREALMPFLWSVVAREGTVWGNRDRGSEVRVTNGRVFSYPGYNELLVGYPDDRIDSNDKVPNPNVTVLEWLHRRRGFDGRVGAFASWDVFPFIINRERSGVYVNAGWEPYEPPDGEAPARFNELMRHTPREWDNVRFDAFTVYAALDYLERERPRVLYLAPGEPDDWAHQRRYDRYLRSTLRFDEYLRELWAAVNAHPDYRGRTTILVTSDHGRGAGAADWTGHGRNVDGAEYIWIAAWGAGVSALGEVGGGDGLTQSQIAATVAALVGADYRASVPNAAPPLPGVSRRR